MVEEVTVGEGGNKLDLIRYYLSRLEVLGGYKSP